ncbi:hypothetical protein L7F22_051905 [Adiantum nelumboides]|nr:hypothetical protein [Adiantum nelumboides]
MAVAEAYLRAMELLLGNGADVDELVVDEIQRALHKGNLAGMRHRLRYGSVVNGQDDFKWTPLHLVVFKGHMKVMRALLEEGVDLQCQDPAAYTPFHCVVMVGNKDIVKLL